VKNGSGWRPATSKDQAGLRKKHGLQGPIDDAFLEPFLLVRPTGTPWNQPAHQHALKRLERFDQTYARFYRAHPRVKNDTDAATAKRRVRDSEVMVKALFDAGVPIVAGTDGALPGYSVLRSIEMYVEAGMTPMQAIESATRVPAEAMGLAKDSGTIEAGKRADLIVLGADPLSNIANIRKLNWVVANGRIMAPGQLWLQAGFR